MDVLSSSTSQLQHFFPKAEVSIPVHTTHHLHHLKPFLSPINVVSIKSTPQIRHHVLDEMPKSNDTFHWNKLIQTHLNNGDSHLILSTYHQMLLRGVRPDRHTLPRLLSASRTLSFGKQLHAQSLTLGLSSDPYVITALIRMYGVLDSVRSAECLFDACLSNNLVQDSISWTLVASLYVKQGKPSLALDLFYRIVDLGTVSLDPVALCTAIGACGLLNSLKEGRKVHKIAEKCGLESDVLVSNSLIKLYLGCDSLKDAQSVFDKMPCKDVISWTGMVRGYVKNGGFNEGLKLFRQMNSYGIKPDSLSVASVLPACARIASHKNGKEVHGYLLRNGIDLNNATLQNALMDMYVKSGFVELANKIFVRMECRDVISWTLMISGYSLHGQGELGVALFCEMQKNSSLIIDEIMYAAVLHACCSARLVQEGMFYFKCIRTPKLTHCALIVTLLARAQLFDEARIFIEKQQIGRNPEVLRSLLDGYRNNKSTKLGKRIIEQLCDLEPLNADNYVLMSNWYADDCKQDMVDELVETIRDMGLSPTKAYSWVEFRNKVHVFGTGDVNHPRSERIYWELQCLMKKIEKEGLINLKSDFSFHDVDEEREGIPIGHSELLAISFGLISTQQGATIRVTKNLRVCRNCHDIAKVVSKMADREIILKDPNCFHHFKDGICSCGDFW